MRRMRHIGLLWMLSIAITATSAAQDEPDFSGRWVLVSSPTVDSNIARSLTVRQPVARTDASMKSHFSELTVDREFVGHARTETYEIGMHAGLIGGGGYRTRLSVRWEDRRLVIETGSYSGRTKEAGPYTEHREEWQLDPAGMLVVSIADSGTDIESKSNTFKYRRN